MFSKKLSLSLALVIFSVQLTACDRFLRSSKSEQEQDDKISVETSQELACLKEMPAKLKLFFEDKAQGPELPESVTCIQNSLKTFMKYTTGNDTSLYTGKEIQHFFNRYLLKESQISDSFQVEIMKAKVIFVGGSSDSFTRAEMDKFIQFIGIFGEKLQALQGRMKMMLFRRALQEVSAEAINQTQSSVRDLVIFFLENTKITSSKYELNDLISLIERVDEFIGKEDDMDTVFKWIPLIKDVKKLFMGESANLSNMTEWKNAFLWTTDAYFTVVRFHYLVKELKYENPLDWNILMNWTDGLLKLVETSPEIQQTKILDATRIDAVINQVYALKLFETVIDQELAKDTYRRAIAFILDRSSNRDAPKEVAGLTLQNLNVIRQEYHVWRLSQQFFVDTFAKANRLKKVANTRNIIDEFNKYDYKKLIESFGVSVMESEDLVQSWKDIRSFIDTPTPIIADAKAKMRMQQNLLSLGTTMAGANLLNSNRSYIRVIIRGYGDNTSKYVFQNSIPKQSFLTLEQDFHDFAVKMGFIDPRNLSPAARTFTEANFLTYNGDGNDLMSGTEAVQLLSMMFSGGRSMTNELYVDLGKVDGILKDRNQGACFTGELDIFGKPVSAEPCFKVVYKKGMARYFEAMPNTKAYLTSLNAQQFEEWYNTIMIPAAIEKHRPGLVEYSEARSINVIMHYIEALMVMFDKNRDQLLNEQELLTAMPRFESFITKMSPLGGFLVSDVFLYMVYKGAKPGAVELGKFAWERKTQGLGTVNRLNIIKVLALLKQQAKEEALKKLEGGN